MKRAGTFFKSLLFHHSFLILFWFCSISLHAQCPSNIDFETGTFNGWTCYTGYTAAVGTENQINISPSGPVPGRHTMYDVTSVGATDPYGGFPVNCPNGSGHSIKLGNDMGGGQAEGISYEFTIPSERNTYSLIYYYAVVFQDPNHESYQQPRMVVEITNVTDGTLISCSSVTFVPFGSVLPGFFISNISGDDGTPVWCKNWSAVTINLNNHAGKTIKLLFKTADCTFRRHFGYAYIDVNSECSDEFVGANYCPDDTAVNVVGPYGYQNYTWFNNSFTQVLGTEQTLTIMPPPPIGTLIALQVVPYSGYGCTDTLYARLMNTLSARADAGKDTLSCNQSPVQIGGPPTPGFVYTWIPSTELTNPSGSNSFATPSVTTAYQLTMRSRGGGCLTRDTVIVKASVINGSVSLIGKPVYCLDNNDSAVLLVNPAATIQWFRDGRQIAGGDQARYKVSQSGTYYALLRSSDGCSLTTEEQTILIDKAKPGITYPLEYAVTNYPLPLQARNFGADYLWTPSRNLNRTTIASPVFTGSTNQEYTIRITTNTGCITVDTQMVKTIKGIEIYVPTAFTPNADGLNDVLRPTLMGVKELRYFRVFNRWGQLVYETRAHRAGWDGNFNGAQQAAGVFVWVAEGIGVDGRWYTKRGTSALIR